MQFSTYAYCWLTGSHTTAISNYQSAHQSHAFSVLYPHLEVENLDFLAFQQEMREVCLQGLLCAGQEVQAKVLDSGYLEIKYSGLIVLLGWFTTFW